MTTLDKAKTHFHYKSMLDARDIELLAIESIRVDLLNQALLKLMTGMKLRSYTKATEAEATSLARVLPHHNSAYSAHCFIQLVRSFNSIDIVNMKIKISIYYMYIYIYVYFFDMKVIAEFRTTPRRNLTVFNCVVLMIRPPSGTLQFRIFVGFGKCLLAI